MGKMRLITKNTSSPKCITKELIAYPLPSIREQCVLGIVKIERIGIHHLKCSNDGQKKQRDRETANNKHSRERVEEDSEVVVAVVEEEGVDSEEDSEGEAVMEEEDSEEEEAVDLLNAEGEYLEAEEGEEEDIEHHDTVLLTCLIVKDCGYVLAVYHLCFDGRQGVIIQIILAHPSSYDIQRFGLKTDVF